jgi:hypothetical protein
MKKRSLFGELKEGLEALRDQRLGKLTAEKRLRVVAALEAAADRLEGSTAGSKIVKATFGMLPESIFEDQPDPIIDPSPGQLPGTARRAVFKIVQRSRNGQGRDAEMAMTNGFAMSKRGEHLEAVQHIARLMSRYGWKKAADDLRGALERSPVKAELLVKKMRQTWLKASVVSVAGGLTPEQLEQLRKSIAGYTYMLGDDGVISNSKGPTSARVSIKGPRLTVEAAGKKLWTGRLDSLPVFLEKFWYATKKSVSGSRMKAAAGMKEGTRVQVKEDSERDRNRTGVVVKESDYRIGDTMGIDWDGKVPVRWDSDGTVAAVPKGALKSLPKLKLDELTMESEGEDV